MKKKNSLEESWKRRTEDAHDRAMKGIQEMSKKGMKINFTSVQRYTGVCRDFLYKDKEIFAMIKAACNKPVASDRQQEEDSTKSELARLRMEVRPLKKENEELKNQLNAPHEYLGKSFKLEEEVKALKAQNAALSKKNRELEKQLETSYAF